MVLEVHLEFIDTSGGEKFCVESDGSSLSTLSDQSGNPTPCPVVVPFSGSCLVGELPKGTEVVPRGRG